jgi:integrase/recombinase XerD
METARSSAALTNAIKIANDESRWGVVSATQRKVLVDYVTRMVEEEDLYSYKRAQVTQPRVARRLRLASMARRSEIAQDLHVTTSVWTRAPVQASISRYVAHSVAPSTRKRYDASWAHWEAFCVQEGVVPAPADIDKLSEFLATQADLKRSASAAAATEAAIADGCRRAGFDSPFLHPRIKMLIKGISSMYAKEAVPRLAFSVEQLRQIMDYARDKDALDTWRSAASIVLMYSEAARGSEIFCLTGESFKIDADTLHVQVARAKNHRFGYRGQIALGASSYNAAKFVLDYMRLIGLAPGAPGYFCCHLWPSTRDRQTTARLDRRMSVSAMQQRCKALLAEIGLDTRLYGTHSSRRAAATAAATDGFSCAEIGDLLRVRSPAIPLTYIRDSAVLRRSLTDAIRLDRLV